MHAGALAQLYRDFARATEFVNRDESDVCSNLCEVGKGHLNTFAISAVATMVLHSVPPPQFEIVESHGPEHNRTFTVKVSINDNKWRGIGSTKKLAEQDSAQRAIQSLL